jgi:predicted RNase H-like HicB family nuclease
MVHFAERRGQKRPTSIENRGVTKRRPFRSGRPRGLAGAQKRTRSTVHCRSAMLLEIMRNFTAVVERDPATGLFVGSVPGWAGAHSQGATLDELQANLREVIEMLLEDGEPQLESEFVGTANVRVA